MSLSSVSSIVRSYHIHVMMNQSSSLLHADLPMLWNWIKLVPCFLIQCISYSTFIASLSSGLKITPSTDGNMSRENICITKNMSHENFCFANVSSHGNVFIMKIMSHENLVRKHYVTWKCLYYENYITSNHLYRENYVWITHNPTTCHSLAAIHFECKIHHFLPRSWVWTWPPPGFSADVCTTSLCSRWDLKQTEVTWLYSLFRIKEYCT